MAKSRKTFQISIESKHLNIPNQTLTLIQNPKIQTLHHLKHSLFSPSIPTQTLDSLFFTFNGKPLHDSSPILPQFSHLSLQFRALGGGGDGGSTCAESRDCYLNMYAVKKPDKVDPNEQRLSKWTTCSLSYEPLKNPIVIDKIGNLFNKEALVEGLIGKNLPKEFGHIKGLKDMIPVTVATIPGSKFDDELRFQCPISGFQFNGKYKFFALRTCGHVLSAKALKEVKSSSCLVCHEGFSEFDKIVINGSEDEVAILRKRMEEEKAKLREKKVNKVKNGDVGVGGNENLSLDLPRLSGAKRGIDVNGVEKVSSKVVDGKGKIGNGGVVVKGASNATKRFKAIDIAPPNATKEVYASIFTSSRKSDFKETYSCRSLPLGRN